MKRVLFVSGLLTLIVAAYSRCREGPYAARRRHFMYPDATLIIESGSTKETIPIVATSYRTRNASSCVRYAGGYAFDAGAWGHVGVRWQDLPWRCLSYGNSPPGYEKRRDYASFVQGVPQELAQVDDWRVEILPKRPREQR